MKKQLLWILALFIVCSGVIAADWAIKHQATDSTQQDQLVMGGTATLSSTSDSTTVTFPTPFHDNTYSFVLTQNAAAHNDSVFVLSKAAATCIIQADSSGATVDWVAIGTAVTY